MAKSIFESLVEAVTDQDGNIDSAQIQRYTGQRIESVDEFMARTEHTGPKNYGRGFLAGVLGGIVGVGIKMLVDRAVAPDTEQLEDKLADDLRDRAERFTGIDLHGADEEAAEAIIEVGIGALIGGVYGLIVEAMPEAKTEQGAGLWTTAQQLALPAMGIIPAGIEDVANDKVQNLAGHVAFGTTVEIVRRASRYYMEER